MRARGIPESQINATLSIQKRFTAIVKQNHAAEDMRQELRKLMRTLMAEMSQEERLALGFTEKAFERQIERAIRPWVRYFLNYDPRPTLKKVTCPVLAINGTKDLQMPANVNLKEIEAALKAGGEYGCDDS